MKSKKPEFFAPSGVAVYPWLNKADEKYGKAQWKCNVRYEATDPTWVKFKTFLDGELAKAFAQFAKENPKVKSKMVSEAPYYMETDDQGDENGNVVLKLKQNAMIGDTPVYVALFGPDLSPINRDETPIYGGSTVRCKFTMRSYFMANGSKVGLNLDLKAVQVQKLVTAGGGRSGESYGFEAVESDESAPWEAANNEPEQADATDPTDF